MKRDEIAFSIQNFTAYLRRHIIERLALACTEIHKYHC